MVVAGVTAQRFSIRVEGRGEGRLTGSGSVSWSSASGSEMHPEPERMPAGLAKRLVDELAKVTGDGS